MTDPTDGDTGAQSERHDRWLAVAASVVGGLSLLAGAGYGLEAAWRAAIVGPAHAASAALGIGIVAMVGGDRLWGTRWAPAAAALSGAGMGVLYLTLFVCYGAFGWMSTGVAAALLLLVTGTGVLQAVRRDSELMACLGLAGGLATPLVVGALAPHGAPYQALMMLVDLAVAAALWRRRWPVLAWLAVVGTGLTWAAGITWGDGGLPVPVAAAVVGVAFAQVARRSDAAVAIPLSVGLGTAGLAALGTVAFHPVAAVAVATVLLVQARQVLADRSWERLRPVVEVITAAALALGGLAAVFADALAPSAAMLLWSVPPLVGWAASMVDESTRPDDPYPTLPLALAAATVATAAALVPHGGPMGPRLALLASLAAGMPLVTLGWRDGRPAAGAPWRWLLLPALFGGAAAAALATGPLALPLAAAGLGWTLLLPRLVGPTDRGATYLPMVASVAWLGAVTWQVSASAPALTGMPALLAGLGCLLVQQRLAPEGMAHRAYQAATVSLAALAVPLQLEREAWTIGWALLAAGLAWTHRGAAQPGRTPVRPLVQAATLGLALLVTLRLTLNPAVLSYHLSDGTPSLWVVYGYGVPLACLVAVERWVGRGRPWVQACMAAVAFAAVNVGVSQLFHTDGALQLVDLTLHARVARTVGWSALGLGLLGGARRWPTLRALGIATLVAVVGKVLVVDLWALEGGGRAALLGGVAVCFLAAAGLLQRRPPADLPARAS